MRSIRPIRHALLALCLISIPLWGQTPTGTISGNVADAGGAAVEGAAVTVTENGTNATFTAKTDSNGRYTVPFVQPGTYSVQIVAPGFTPSRQTGLAVTTASNVTADFALAVGRVSDTVQVSVDTQRLDTETSNLSSTISSREILDLPDNGRNPFDFATLAPGVSTVGNASTPHIGGSRNGNNEQLIDGMTNILPENNVGNNLSAYTPVVDSVQEVNVQSSVLEAEYGRFSGGIISLTTKGGTNQFHGSGFEFYESNAFAALPFGSTPGSTSADSHRYQTGGTFSGPIRRDKTFFFFDFEDSRQSSAGTSVFNLPAANWLKGDFSTLTDGKGNPVTIYDPLTVHPVATDTGTAYVRDPFPGNVIPANRLTSAGSLIAQKVLSYYPAPASATQATTHTTPGNTTNDYYHFDARVDQQFSTKWHSFLRFSHSAGSNTYISDFGNVASPGGYNGPTKGNAYSLSVDNTISFTPTLLGEFRYGFSKSVSVRTASSQGFDPTTLGLPADVTNESKNNVTLFPHFGFSGGYSDIGNLGYVPLQENPLAHDVNGSLIKILGGHTLKVGGEFRHLNLDFYQYTYPSGTFNVDESWTRMNPQDATTGGSSFASFLLGLPSSGDITNDPHTVQNSNYLAFYGQDDWKVSKTFTLNYGLRWDVEIPRTEKSNQLSVWNSTAASPLGAVAPADGVVCPYCGNLLGQMQIVGTNGFKYGRHQVATQKKDFGPRLGFAYNPLPKLAFRGGFGVVFQPSALQAAGTSGSPGIEGFTAQTNFSPSFDNQHSAPVTDISNPFPTGYQRPQALDPTCRASATCIQGIDLGNGISQSFFDKIRNPYTMQWNLSTQLQLPQRLKGEVAYLGNRGLFLINGDPGLPFDQLPLSDLALGNHLFDQVANPFYQKITTLGSSLSQATVQRSQLLRRYPQYGGVSSFRKPDADSIYHAFYLRLDREFSQGLLFTIAFTGGKAIDNAASSVNYLGPAAQTYADQYNPRAERGLSAYDVSKLFTSSVVYELPFGRNKMFGNNLPEYANLLLGGWQANGIITYSDGTPVVLAAVDNGTTAGGIFTFGQRPAWTGKSAKLSNPTKNDWFDTTVYSKPAPFTIGNAPRVINNVRNPHADNLDFSLVKNDRWGSSERYNFQFRLEMFNAFNHPLLSAPDANVNDGNYGKITSYANSARQIQLGFKQYF